MAQDELTEFLEHGTVRAYRAKGCRCDECRAVFARDRYSPADPVGVTLENVEPPGDWISRARCKTAPVNLFFPERGDDAGPAKRICARCPVLSECRDYALDAPSTLQGVWGGLSRNERSEARPGRRIA